MRNIPVRRMVLEKLCLALVGVFHIFVDIDILLRAVYYADKAELKGVDTAGEHIEGICALVHEVELREHADGPSALGVDRPGEFERFGVGEVDIGARDG